MEEQKGNDSPQYMEEEGHWVENTILTSTYHEKEMVYQMKDEMKNPNYHSFVLNSINCHSCIEKETILFNLQRLQSFIAKDYSSFYLPLLDHQLVEIVNPDHFCFLAEVPHKYCARLFDGPTHNEHQYQYAFEFEKKVNDTGVIEKAFVKELIDNIKRQSKEDLMWYYTDHNMSIFKQDFYIRFRIIRRIWKLITHSEIQPLIKLEVIEYIDSVYALLNKLKYDYHDKDIFTLDTNQLTETVLKKVFSKMSSILLNHFELIGKIYFQKSIRNII